MNNEMIVDVAQHAFTEASKTILRIAETMPDTEGRAIVALIASSMMAGKVAALRKNVPALAEFSTEIEETVAGVQGKQISEFASKSDAEIQSFAAKHGIDVDDDDIAQMRSTLFEAGDDAVDLDGEDADWAKELAEAGNSPEVVKVMVATAKAATAARNVIAKHANKLDTHPQQIAVDIAAGALLGGRARAAKGFNRGLTALVELMDKTGYEAQVRVLTEGATAQGKTLDEFRSA